MATTRALENAAILISLLPANDAEQVLQRLPASEAMAIRNRAGQCASTSSRRMTALREFIRDKSSAAPAGRRLRFDRNHPSPAFRYLNQQCAIRMAETLKHELPRVTATILSNVPARQAAEVMARLPEDYQADVVGEMLSGSPASREVVCVLAASLAEVLADHQTELQVQQHATCHLTAMLRWTDPQTRQRLTEVAQREGIRIDVDAR